MRIITCPVCTEPFPFYLFEFGIPFWCRCGAIIGRPTEDASAPGPTRSGDRTASRTSGVSSRPTSDPAECRNSESSGIELSPAEWQELQAELEARTAGTAPEFNWPYQYDLRFSWELDDGRKAKELQRRADRICYLISATSYSREQIEHEKRELRARCEEYFPEIEGAYEKVYARRFDKLWGQFREG